MRASRDFYLLFYIGFCCFRDLITQSNKVTPFDPVELTSAIEQVKIMSGDPSTPTKPFLADHNGNSGFDIYNIQYDPTTKQASYIQVRKSQK